MFKPTPREFDAITLGINIMTCKKIVIEALSELHSRGDHSLLYFAYTCVWDLFNGGVIYLAKKL
jgi:hypothetical protein